MKPHEILKAEAPSVELLGMAAAAQIMAKARVSAYTRKDGAFVPEHDRKVKASAKPAGGAPAAVKAAAGSLGGDAEWKHEAGVSHNIHPLTPSRASAVEDALADSGWEKSGDDTYKHPEGHVASLAGGKLKITHATS